MNKILIAILFLANMVIFAAEENRAKKQKLEHANDSSYNYAASSSSSNSTKNSKTSNIFNALNNSKITSEVFKDNVSCFLEDSDKIYPIEDIKAVNLKGNKEFQGTFLCISPNTEFLLTESENSIILYNINTKETITQISHNTEDIVKIFFSKDSNKFAVCSASNVNDIEYEYVIYVYQIDGKLINKIDVEKYDHDADIYEDVMLELLNNEDDIEYIEFTPNGNDIFIKTVNNMRLYNINTNKKVFDFRTIIQNTNLSSDVVLFIDSWLISLDSKKMAIWYENGQSIYDLETNNIEIDDDFQEPSPDIKKCIRVSGQDENFTIINNIVNGEVDVQKSVVYSGRVKLVSDNFKLIILINCATEELLNEDDLDKYNYKDSEKFIHVRDLQTNQILLKIKQEYLNEYSVSEFNSDLTKLYIATFKKLLVYDLSTGDLLNDIDLNVAQCHSHLTHDYYNSIEVSKDARFILMSRNIIGLDDNSQVKTISVVDTIENKVIIKDLPCNSYRYNSRFIQIYKDNCTHVYSLMTGSEILRLTGVFTFQGDHSLVDVNSNDAVIYDLNEVVKSKLTYEQYMLILLLKRDFETSSSNNVSLQRIAKNEKVSLIQLFTVLDSFNEGIKNHLIEKYRIIDSDLKKLIEFHHYANKLNNVYSLSLLEISKKLKISLKDLLIMFNKYTAEEQEDLIKKYNIIDSGLVHVAKHKGIIQIA